MQTAANNLEAAQVIYINSDVGIDQFQFFIVPCLRNFDKFGSKKICRLY